MLPCTQWPVFGNAIPLEIRPYINVSLQNYVRQSPPFDTKTDKSPAYFAFLEACQNLSLPVDGVKHLGSKTSAQVFPHLAEVDVAPLILSDASLYESLSTALVSQQHGGSMIIVVDDIVSLSSVQILYLLCACYKTVQLHTVSGISHQLVQCAGYLGISRTIQSLPPYDMQMSSYFVTHLEEINSIYGQSRLEHTRCRDNKDWGRLPKKIDTM